MGVVTHNTDAMRTWSGDITNAANDYRDYINSLYNLVDTLVSADFTGGLSKDFENAVLDKRDDFNRLGEVLDECSDLIDKTSTTIDNDEEELKASIESHNSFN